MAQVINTNISALFAGSALNKSALSLQTAQQRLSSGLRINSAHDDPTGLSIATGFDSQIRGTNMAITSANTGISTAQTNDGYLAQITSNLQRLREIAVQNGGTLPVAATAAGAESDALLLENTRINGLVNAASTNVVNNSNGGVFATTGVKPTLAAVAAGTVAQLDTDIASVSAQRSHYGADMVALGSAVATMQTASVNLSSSYSRIMDTDYAAETASMARNNILQQAGTAVLAQANQTPNTVMTLLR